MMVAIRRTTPFVSGFILGLTLLFSSFPASGQADRSFNALLIYGNGGIATWGQNFNEYFRNFLGPDLGQYFTPEFVALITTDPAEYELIARSLALKYSNTHIDLLIPVLPESNSFVHEWGHVFAPNAATLHVLPGNDVHTNPESLGPREAVVASAITTAVAETARLMPVLLPELEQVYVVGGAGEGDLSYMERYRQTLNSLESPLQFYYLSGLPPDELIARLQQVPENSAVLMTTYDRDQAGRPFRTIVVTNELSESLSIPVFGNTDTLPRNGALGGSISSAVGYARSAYELTSQYMNGGFPTGVVSADVDFLFNGAQLDRFGIDRSLLPEGSEIIMDPFNLWRDYGVWITVAGFVIVVQLLLIGLLLAARQRSRLAEEQLSKASKMEALGTLAGGIAHDFNNILMAISANTELANMQLGNDELVKDRLAKIHSASDRAEHLVSQILMFSRQSQQQELKSVQLCALLDESIEHIRSLMPDSCKVIFQCHAPEAFIEADANQLHQVFMNLCINAQHAMEGKGAIEISADELEMDSRENFLGQLIPGGHYIQLQFTDTGSGIDPANLRHVFEPFFTTKPMGKGTGLGLALVYQIIKAHNGYIDIHSVPGEGTTVDVLLQSSGLRQEVTLSRPGTVIEGQNKHILLVDDDNMVLDANCENLRTLGYRVTAFSSSVVALEYFKKHQQQFDLLLTDLSMPEMDGVRLINNIRQLSPALPVILCTGYLDALQSPDLDALQVMKKPFSMLEISEALHSALKSEPGHRNN